MTVNMTILQNLMGNDEKLVTKVLKIFCTAMPEELRKLETYLAENNFQMAAISAHSIKTQCAYLGLEDISKHAYSIEIQADNKATDHTTPGLYSQLSESITAEIVSIKMTRAL